MSGHFLEQAPAPVEVPLIDHLAENQLILYFICRALTATALVRRIHTQEPVTTGTGHPN